MQFLPIIIIISCNKRAKTASRWGHVDRWVGFMHQYFTFSAEIWHTWKLKMTSLTSSS